jgi:hypothetical protein
MQQPLGTIQPRFVSRFVGCRLSGSGSVSAVAGSRASARVSSDSANDCALRVGPARGAGSAHVGLVLVWLGRSGFLLSNLPPGRGCCFRSARLRGRPSGASSLWLQGLCSTIQPARLASRSGTGHSSTRSSTESHNPTFGPACGSSVVRTFHLSFAVRHHLLNPARRCCLSSHLEAWMRSGHPLLPRCCIASSLEALSPERRRRGRRL